MDTGKNNLKKLLFLSMNRITSLQKLYGNFIDFCKKSKFDRTFRVSFKKIRPIQGIPSTKSIQVLSPVKAPFSR
jgi:hypothetical protein